MFVRSVKAPRGNYEYLRLVESYRQGTKVKQRIVVHLGRKDLLAPHLDTLVRLLQTDSSSSRWVRSEDITTPQAATWGPLLVIRHLFAKLALDRMLDAGGSPLRHGQPLSERLFPLLANRLTRPGSEHALAPWLEEFYVCTAQGRRWQPQWKPSHRVKVSFEQLKLWYQTLDDLLAQKARLEKELYLELRHLFSLQPDLVFYDLTSTYFEGTGPASLARFGYSRDERPRNRQILVGVVMMDGWPIAHHVFAGNRLDQSTVLEVVEDLRQRFGLNRMILVGDRGLVTLRNLEELHQAQQGYLLGLQRRNRQNVYEYIQQAEARSDWQECPAGITASEKSAVPRTRVVEVPGRQPGVRKIGAAAASKLRRHHGHRYFAWELRQGKFRFFEHPLNLRREKALEGKYVIQTEEPHLTPLQAVAAYKQLNEVERAFAHLKHLVELRPVFHQQEERVRAHVFVAALALLVDRALEKELQTASSGLSSPAAWQALETIRCVEVGLGSGHKLCVTRGSQHAASVLRALRITELDPPRPASGQEYVM